VDRLQIIKKFYWDFAVR